MWLFDLFKLIIDILMIFMPTLSFTQFFIADEQTIKSFNLGTCYVYIACNIFRIGFYFGEHYETSLLIQSFFLIGLMVTVIVHCAQYKKVDLKRLFSIMGIFTFFVFLFSYITRNVNFIVQSIGMASTIVEVALAFPQIIQNFKVKSGEGIPLSTLGMWMFGDGFKTTYFLCVKAPIQFILIGVIQLSCDFILAFQIYLYSPQIYDTQLIQPVKKFISKFTKEITEETTEFMEDLNDLITPEEANQLSIVTE